ncbi:MAG: hypothetical protein FJ189_09660 [Gammaproteobacteria bacterium]|nr:hypothetical protein [Gammaproteobacteria bacterium]
MAGARRLFPALCLLCAATGARAESLLELYRVTLDSNPILKGKEFALDQAKAQQDQALSKLLPQLMATGSYQKVDFRQSLQRGPQNLPDNRDFSEQYWGNQGTIQARQALFDLPSYLRLQGAESFTLQSENEVDAVRMAVAYDLADRYLNALLAEADINYVVAEKESVKEKLAQMRYMQERQMATVTDLYQVEAYFSALITREIEVKNAKAVALEKLRETTGIGVKSISPLVQERFTLLSGEIDDWVRDALHFNPKLTALGHAIEGSSKMVSGSQAEHLPTANLVASQTYSNLGFQDRRFPPYTSASVGVQIQVPIYSGGGTQARVQESVARWNQMREQYEQQRREIEKETRTAFLDVMASHARIDSTNQEVVARAKAVDAQYKAYDLGTTTIVDVLETRRLLLRGRVEQARARYDFVRALIALRMWAGSLHDPEIEAIGNWFVTKPQPAVPPKDPGKS